MDDVTEMAQAQENRTLSPGLLGQVLPAGMSDIGTVRREPHALGIRPYSLGRHNTVDEPAEGAGGR